MKKLWMLALVLAASCGCARVQVQAPKEPIKIDIAMRLDVYQHVVKDIDAIESLVKEPQAKKPDAAKPELLNFLSIPQAYAQDLSPEVENAALRRRDRLAELTTWQEKGVVGENNLGLLEIKDAALADATTENLLKEENADRMVIYNFLAQKNGTDVPAIQKIYAERLQKDAPAGTPIEVMGDSGYEWQKK